MRPQKRRRRVLAVIAGLGLLLALAGVIGFCGSRQAPQPNSSPSSAAAVSPHPSLKPTARPTLRPPAIIATPPPTATPAVGGVGKG